MINTIKYIILFICLLPAGVCTLPEESCAEKTVTDQLGRSITIPDSPRRVVSMAPSITEIMFSLKVEDRLVGVTQFSDYPDEACLLPKVGSYVNLDIEKIVALKPDLCLATQDGNPKEVVTILDSLNIPVYAVNPRNLDTVMETVKEIGDLLDAHDQAGLVAGEMKERIEKIRTRISKSSGRPKVFFQIGISPIVSAGTPTFIHELIEMAGGENLAKGPVPYPRFSHEQILSMGPEVFIITSMARGAVFERVKREWCRWPSIPAVKNNRIVVVDADLLHRPTPRLVDGLEMLAELIHPELFKENP